MLIMGNKPNKTWGNGMNAAPPSANYKYDSFGQRCGMLPKTKEKSDNRLVDRAMLENGLLF